MRVTIHQPHYVPWEGYLRKWASADLLIVLDTVQFEKHGYQNRTRVDGRWLTVPVHASLGVLIQDVRIDNTQPWVRKHRAALPQFADLYDGLPWDRLVPLALATMDRLSGGRPRVLASALGEMPRSPTGELSPTERLVALCCLAGATTYVSGPHGARYLDEAQFRKAGIAVEMVEGP